jgi:itaconate CoA-transferase
VTGPLAGVLVVALEQAVSAPLASRTLADLGARVVKVENPRGGDMSRHYDDVVAGSAAHFVWVNRGKESLTLDLLHRLLDRADALVTNLAPGAADRLGIGPAQLAERHPRVVGVEITGYGPGGPLSGKRAYDLLVQAESGACSITGREGEPAKGGPPYADAASGLYAAIAVLAGLFRRQAGGPAEGAHVAMFDVMTELMGYALTYTRHTGVEQQPQGMGSPAVVPYGAHRTADGQTVVLGTTNDAEWRRLARDLLGRPDLADDPRYATAGGRVAHRAALDAEVGAWCARHDLAAAQAAADAAGIGNARYNTPAEVNAHPHLAARPPGRALGTPRGPRPAHWAPGWTRYRPWARTPTPCSASWACPTPRSRPCARTGSCDPYPRVVCRPWTPAT